jgi:hypothetical protein
MVKSTSCDSSCVLGGEKAGEPWEPTEGMSRLHGMGMAADCM